MFKYSKLVIVILTLTFSYKISADAIDPSLFTDPAGGPQFIQAKSSNKPTSWGAMRIVLKSGAGEVGLRSVNVAYTKGNNAPTLIPLGEIYPLPSQPTWYRFDTDGYRIYCFTRTLVNGTNEDKDVDCNKVVDIVASQNNILLGASTNIPRDFSGLNMNGGIVLMKKHFDNLMQHK